MFGRKKSTDKSTALLEIEDLIEQPDISSCFNFLPLFNLKVVPVNSELNNPLVLKENIYQEGEETYRVDFVMTPKRGIRRLEDGRIAIEANLSIKIEDILQCLRHTNGKEFFKGEIKRYITSDGSELYTHNNNEILEVKTDQYCEKCKECKEKAPIVGWVYPTYFEYYTSGREKTVNEIRKYIIKPSFLGFLFGTGVHIAAVNHPCQKASLHEILDPNYKHKVADPPGIEIVFPKQK